MLYPPGDCHSLQNLKLAALAACQCCPVNGDSSLLAVPCPVRDGGTWCETEGFLSALQNNRARAMARQRTEKLKMGAGEGRRMTSFAGLAPKSQWKKKKSCSCLHRPGPNPSPCRYNTADDRASFPHTTHSLGPCVGLLSACQSKTFLCPLPTVEMAFLMLLGTGWGPATRFKQGTKLLSVIRHWWEGGEGKNRAICPCLAKHLGHMSGLLSELLVCLEPPWFVNEHLKGNCGSTRASFQWK